MRRRSPCNGQVDFSVRKPCCAPIARSSVKFPDRSRPNRKSAPTTLARAASRRAPTHERFRPTATIRVNWTTPLPGCRLPERFHFYRRSSGGPAPCRDERRAGDAGPNVRQEVPPRSALTRRTRSMICMPAVQPVELPSARLADTAPDAHRLEKGYLHKRGIISGPRCDVRRRSAGSAAVVFRVRSKCVNEIRGLTSCHRHVDPQSVVGELDSGRQGAFVSSCARS